MKNSQIKDFINRLQFEVEGVLKDAHEVIKMEIKVDQAPIKQVDKVTSN